MYHSKHLLPCSKICIFLEASNLAFRSLSTLPSETSETGTGKQLINQSKDQIALVSSAHQLSQAKVSMNFSITKVHSFIHHSPESASFCTLDVFVWGRKWEQAMAFTLLSCFVCVNLFSMHKMVLCKCQFHPCLANLGLELWLKMMAPSFACQWTRVEQACGVTLRNREGREMESVGALAKVRMSLSRLPSRDLGVDNTTTTTTTPAH